MAMPFKDGMDAYQRGDYATAMRLWRPLADQGNAAAQLYLGGEPVSDIDTAVVDSLKVLDLKWPIREADTSIG